MKTILVATFLGGLMLSLEACYSYRTIQDIKKATPGGELRVTTTDGRTLYLQGWEVDTSSAIRGMQQIERREERPVSIALDEIETVEQREFDTTTTIVVFVPIGILLILGIIVGLGGGPPTGI